MMKDLRILLLLISLLFLSGTVSGQEENGDESTTLPEPTESAEEEESSSPSSESPSESSPTSESPPGGGQCGPGEEPSECRPCDGTCLNPNPICAEICINGTYCRCRQGYVRISANECIPVDQCPAASSFRPPRQCGPNEEPSECRPCDGTCQNPNPICPLLACIQNNRTYCRCREGYVRFGFAGRCIPAEQCPTNRFCCNFFRCFFCAPGFRCANIFPGFKHCVPSPNSQNCGIVPCRPGTRCVIIGGTPYCVPVPGPRYPPLSGPDRD